MPLNKSAQVLRFFAQQYGPPGIPRKRLVKLAYMADLLARQYLGRPITDFEYIKDHYGPNTRALPDRVAELTEGGFAEESVEREERFRTIRLRDSHQPHPFSFSRGENEVLAYVQENYLDMELQEFIDLVVKETDPFTAVSQHGETIPMDGVNNEMRARIGFDLEAILSAESQAETGEYKTLREFSDGLRAEIAARHSE